MLCIIIIIKRKPWSSHTLNPSQICVCVWAALEAVAQGSLLIGERELQVNKVLQRQIKLFSSQNPEIIHSRPALGLQRGISSSCSILLVFFLWTCEFLAILSMSCAPGLGYGSPHPPCCSSYLTWTHEVTEAVLFLTSVHIRAEVTRLYTQRLAGSGISTWIQLMMLNLAQSGRF